MFGDPWLLDEVPPQVMLPGADCHHALLVPAHAFVVVVEHDGVQADGDFVPVRQALDEGAQLFDGDQMARAFSGSSPLQLDLGLRQGAIVARDPGTTSSSWRRARRGRAGLCGDGAEA